MTTLEALRALENSLKESNNTVQIFITGGFVRDFLRRKRNKDLDAVLFNATLNMAQKHLKKFGKTKRITIHHVSGTKPVTCLLFKADGDDSEAQITQLKVPRSMRKNDLETCLKHDSKQRDFTINAMYLPINSVTSRNVIDFWSGRNDIEGKQLLSVVSAKNTFEQSPIRILRAFSLASRTKYTIAQHVKEAIASQATLLSKVPAEAIKAELEEILLSHKPSIYLKQMLQLGVLKVILPELHDCAFCTQDKRYHKYDVFKHLVYTCDNIEADLVLRLAGLLHDIGKPAARNEVNSKVTFYKHEVVGARMVRNILKRLRFDNDTIEKLLTL